MSAPPIPKDKAPALLRQRLRSDGTWRVWWEPQPRERQLGFVPVELDAKRPTWSIREAERLNREAAAARKAGKRQVLAQGGRTVEALVERYRQSRHWKGHSDKTRATYAIQFRQIVAKWGQHLVRDFTKPAMDAWYETLLETTSQHTATARIRHMSILMGFAETIDWRAENSNPCAKLKVGTPPGRRRVAGWAEVDALSTAAIGAGLASVDLALRLSLFQGQRETDVLAATVGQFRRQAMQLLDWPEPRQVWIWQLVRSKRGNEGAMLVHPELVPALEAAIAAAEARVQARLAAAEAAIPGEEEAALRAALAAEPLVWDEVTGKPYTEATWQYRWRRVRRLAAARANAPVLSDADRQALADLGRLQFRDLRRTFGVRARAGGASKDDTGDVLGNSAAVDQQLGDIYMAPSLDTASRAVLAMQRPAKERKRA